MPTRRRPRWATEDADKILRPDPPPTIAELLERTEDDPPDSQ